MKTFKEFLSESKIPNGLFDRLSSKVKRDVLNYLCYQYNRFSPIRQKKIKTHYNDVKAYANKYNIDIKSDWKKRTGIQTVSFHEKDFDKNHESKGYGEVNLRYAWDSSKKQQHYTVKYSSQNDSELVLNIAAYLKNVWTIESDDDHLEIYLNNVISNLQNDIKTELVSYLQNNDTTPKTEIHVENV